MIFEKFREKYINKNTLKGNLFIFHGRKKFMKILGEKKFNLVIAKKLWVMENFQCQIRNQHPRIIKVYYSLFLNFFESENLLDSVIKIHHITLL